MSEIVSLYCYQPCMMCTRVGNMASGKETKMNTNQGNCFLRFLAF